MRIYISGKITGDPDYYEKFGRAQARLEKEFENAQIINPALVGEALPEDFSYKDYMDIDFLLLDKSDAIYMLRDWMESPGSCMEYGYSMASDKIILRED